MKYIGKIIVFSISALAIFSSCDSYDRTEVTNEIYVNKSSLTLFVGQKDTLLLSPTSGSTAEWTVSDTDVASVENGVVTAIGAGNTNITVKRGNATFTIAVKVTEKYALTDITLTASTLFGDYIVELLPGQSKKVEASMVM